MDNSNDVTTTSLSWMDPQQDADTVIASLTTEGLEDGRRVEKAQLQDVHRLLATAVLMQKRLGSQALPTLDDLAQERGIQRKSLVVQMNAIAEVFNTHHEEYANSVCKYVTDLGLSGASRQVAFLEHVLYDETPLRARVRFKGQRHVQRSKAFVLEPYWGIVVRRCQQDTSPTSGDQRTPIRIPDSEYLFLWGKHPVCLRGAEGTSGEALLPVLQSIPPPPASATSFDHHLRIIECDEVGGNRRAEQLLAQQRPKSWKAATVLCTAHKVHAAAERTWSLQPLPGILSGLVNTSLFLRNPGCMKALQEALELQLREMPLEVLPSPASSAAAASHRAWLVQLLGPGATKQPRRHALLEVLSTKLVNGDWTHHSLQHHCPANCCNSREETRDKLCKHMVRILVALPPHVLNRSNWRDWRKGLRLYALLESIHGLWSASFRRAFAASNTGPPLDLQLPLDDQQPHDQRQDPSHLQGRLQQQPPPQPVNPLQASDEQKRAERMQHLRAAMQLLDSRDWVDTLLVMLQSLRPQQDLMSQVLWKAGGDYECQQLLQLDTTGRREWRALHLHEQHDLNEYLQTTIVNLHDNNVWQLDKVPDTEEYRSFVFTAAMRGPAHCHLAG